MIPSLYSEFWIVGGIRHSAADFFPKRHTTPGISHVFTILPSNSGVLNIFPSKCLSHLIKAYHRTFSDSSFPLSRDPKWKKNISSPYRFFFFIISYTFFFLQFVWRHIRIKLCHFNSIISSLIFPAHTYTGFS